MPNLFKFTKKTNLTSWLLPACFLVPMMFFQSSCRSSKNQKQVEESAQSNSNQVTTKKITTKKASETELEIKSDKIEIPTDTSTIENPNSKIAEGTDKKTGSNDKESFFSKLKSPFVNLFKGKEKKVKRKKVKQRQGLRFVFTSKTGADIKIRKTYGEKLQRTNQFANLEFQYPETISAEIENDSQKILDIEKSINTQFEENLKQFGKFSKLNFKNLIVDSLTGSENPRWKLDDQIIQLILCLPNPKNQNPEYKSKNFRIRPKLAKVIYRPINAKGDPGKTRIFTNVSLNPTCP